MVPQVVCADTFVETYYAQNFLQEKSFLGKSNLILKVKWWLIHQPGLILYF